MDKFEVVIPVIPQDFKRCYKNYNLMERFLPVKRFVFIGPEELKEEIEKLELNHCEKVFINENDIIPFNDVKRAITNRVEREGYTIAGNSRLGWYYQQFLKLSYSEICDEDYYFVWDSDTIPVRPVELLNENGIPYLDVKVEYYKSYFDTIHALFPELDKAIDYSFISEHMLFSVKNVKEMIHRINDTDYQGDTYYEKIMSAIELANLKLGFSEFETYGTYMYVNHPDDYEIRRWYSMRSAGYMFEADKLTVDDIEWLAKDFSALSFEKNSYIVGPLYDMFHNENYRRLLTPMQIYMKVQESGLFSGMKDG